ncbi:uncharacterized protein LOC133519568 isoform X3 [Cydia pomonella]|nr:uncharacterized protein LOC133519568 isoform X3 [Cydia pomonella]
MDEWDRINKLAMSEASSEKVEIDVTGMSKEQRTKIHDAVKKAFGNSIVGSTIGEGDKKLVRFERYRKGGWLPTDINPFARVSTQDIMRDQNRDFSGVSTHSYDRAARLANSMCIGAVSTVPYNHENALARSRLSHSGFFTTIPYDFTQRDSSTMLSHNFQSVGGVPTMPSLFTRRGSVSTLTSVFTNDERMALSHSQSSGSVVGPVAYPSSAQGLSRTQLDGRVAGPAWKTNSGAPGHSLSDSNLDESEALPTDTECHAHSIIIEDSNDSPAVSDVSEQTEQDAISVQFDANWTIQNPGNKTIKRVSEPIINEKKKKKNRKQRRKAREQARQAIEMNTIPLYTCLPDASKNTNSVPYNTPNKNEENPNISRKRTTEEVISPADPKRNKLSAKKRKQETVSHKRDNIDNNVEAKRQKTETTGNITYEEAIKLGLIVSITTLNGHFSPQLSEEFQQKIQTRLMEEARQPNASPGPIFRGKPIYSNGALRLWCEDETTLSWLKHTTSTINISSGNKIIVKSQRQVEPMVRCGIVLPGIWDDFSLVAKTLRYQNAWAEVDRWKLHRIEKQETDTFAVVYVPEILVKKILEHGRRLGFMLGSVYIKFQGSRGKYSELPPQNVLQNMHKRMDSAITNQQSQTLDRTDSILEKDVEFGEHLESEREDFIRHHSESGDNTQATSIERQKKREGIPREGIPFSQL